MRRFDRTTVDLFVRKLPAEVHNTLLNSDGKVVLAGGYLRAVLMHQKIRDIDLFVADGDRSTAEAVTTKILAEGNAQCHAKKVMSLYKGFTTGPVAFTLESDVLPVQVCWGRKFSSPANLIEGFDLGPSQACLYYLSGYGWEAFGTDAFWTDINNLSLTYLNCSSIKGMYTSGARILRYLKYGFKMDSHNLQKWLEDTAEATPRDY